MNRKITTNLLVRVALLAVIATIMKQFNLRLPLFPGFLQLDVSELPAVIAVVTTGPLAGFLVVLLKNILDPIIFGTNTGGVGNFANFIMGTALILPFALVYRWRKDSIGYLLGSIAGILSLLVVSSLVNYFIMLPLFVRLFMPMETIIGIANAVNDRVVDVPTLIVFAIAPFNLVKGSLVMVLGFALYRGLRPVFRAIECF